MTTTSPVDCEVCADTGWELLHGVETVKGNKAHTAVRRCPKRCRLPPDEGMRVVYVPPEQPDRERPTESVAFS